MALLTSYAKARVRQRVIGSAKGISITGASTALGASANNTVNVPGAKVDDIVCITVQTPSAGFIVDAYVSSASTVTIRQNNVAGANPATPSTTLAQLEVLRP